MIYIIYSVTYTYTSHSHLLLHFDDLSQLRQLGEQKILSMVESKEFRKGIVQLEWSQRKSQMKMEDLHNTAREIQMLKVTRDIQQVRKKESEKVSCRERKKEYMNTEQMDE